MTKIKNTKLYIGAALAVQSFTSFIMFLVYLKKNKSLATTFFGLGLIGGIASAYLLYTEYQIALSEKAECEDCCDCCDCDDDCDCCDCEDGDCDCCDCEDDDLFEGNEDDESIDLHVEDSEEESEKDEEDDTDEDDNDSDESENDDASPDAE